MKKLLSLTILLAAFAVVHTTARAQDLSMREAAYLHFYDDGRIDLTTPYVTPGKTYTINKQAGKQLSGDTFSFAVGIIVFRDQLNFPSNAFKASLTSGDQTTSLIFSFKKDDQKTQETRNETPPLKMGLNKITFRIDPDNQIAEKNERNNSMTFYINIVEELKNNPRPKVAPGRRN